MFYRYEHYMSISHVALIVSMVQDDPRGIVQETEIRPLEEMVYVLSITFPGEWDAQTLLGFWDTKRSPNLGQTTRPYNDEQKKRSCRIVDFAVPTDLIVKLKECEKRKKYPNLC